MSLLKNAIEARMGQINEYMKYTSEASVVDSLIEYFPVVKDDDGVIQGVVIEGSIDYSGVDVVVRGMMKIGDATPVLKFLASKGYRQTENAEKLTYTAGWIWKCGSITIRGYFSGEDDASCKMVQTGTKTVEQPIYEMQCDEIVPPSIEEEDGDVERLATRTEQAI